MFVFYFGVLSAITPPVAIGAFAAAPIAKSSPMQTAFVAARLAWVGFIIPFIFVYEPALLFIGGFQPEPFFRVCVALALAIWLLNTALSGYSRVKLAMPERAVRLLLAVPLMIQIPSLQYAAIVGFVLYFLTSRVLGSAKQGQSPENT
jgi:TRAP-type uncharacterized transport system fused permease subunit